MPGVKGIGEKTAALLLSYFHTVDKLYGKLGLIDLPPVPENMKNLPPTSKELQSHLKDAVTPQIYETALLELEKCFDLAGAKSKKAATLLSRLYLCPYKTVLLYKQLVTLKDNLEVEDFVLATESINALHSSSFVCGFLLLYGY